MDKTEEQNKKTFTSSLLAKTFFIETWKGNSLSEAQKPKILHTMLGSWKKKKMFLDNMPSTKLHISVFLYQKIFFYFLTKTYVVCTQ